MKVKPVFYCQWELLRHHISNFNYFVFWETIKKCIVAVIIIKLNTTSVNQSIVLPKNSIFHLV